jgi:hypothetical protein
VTGQQLQLTAPGLDPAEAQKLTAALEARGLRARWQDDKLSIEPKEPK